VGVKTDVVSSDILIQSENDLAPRVAEMAEVGPYQVGRHKRNATFKNGAGWDFYEEMIFHGGPWAMIWPPLAVLEFL
jgi:hypothetical protein